MKKTILILVAASGLVLANAYTYKSCMDSSYGGTSAMRACIDAELKYQDLLLNKHYKIARKSLNTAKKKELKLVQRAWIKYRDLVCKFNDDLTGGTMDALAADECFLKITKQRAIDLRNIYDYGYEDSSAPVETPRVDTGNQQEKKKENPCALSWNQITGVKEKCKIEIFTGREDDYGKCYKREIRSLVNSQGCKE